MNTVERTLWPLLSVGSQFRQQVTLVVDRFGTGDPEMVVGVADRDIGLKGIFRGLGEPVGASGNHGALHLSI